MSPTDLPNILLTGTPALYCAGLLLGFDSLIKPRGRPADPPGTTVRPPAPVLERRHERLRSERSRAIRISVARSPDAVEEAACLVQRRYAWRGYEFDASSANTRRGIPIEPQEITLLAKDGEAALGTLTIRLDSPLGLCADEGYGEAIEAARVQGGQVCELTRLALAEACDWKAVLASLFSVAYTLGRTVHGVTDVFIEVNPRHVSFYQRALGFVVAAGERFCDRVKAPSVLLKLELAGLEQRMNLTPSAVVSQTSTFARAAA